MIQRDDFPGIRYNDTDERQKERKDLPVRMGGREGGGPISFRQVRGYTYIASVRRYPEY